MKPDPILIEWQGRPVRIRHDDPTLRPYTPTESRLRAAMSLATDVEGLRLVLASTVAERYEVTVPDGGMVVELRRRTSGE